MLEKLHRTFLFFLVLTLFSVPIYYKFQWNHDDVTLGSDPQIKYYQAYAFYKDGINRKNLECFFPAESFGFSEKYIPIGYPWAFINTSKECFFQYPIFMPVLHALIGKFVGMSKIIYIPIFFFFLNFLLSIKLFEIFGFRFLESIYLSLYLHFLTPVFLSSLDYSEVTFTNTFLLFSLYLYEKRKENEQKLGIWQSLFCGFCIAFTFQLRPEITISIILLFLVGFLFNLKQVLKLKIYILIGFFFVIFTLIASYLNFTVYHHIFGMRGLNTIQDSQMLSLNQYTLNWIADLWGSDFKIGLVKAFPILLLLSIIGLIRIITLKNYNQYFIAGFIFIVLLPILSPYRAGVDIMGLRYYESGVYLLSFGSFSLILKNLNQNFNTKLFKSFLVSVVLFVSVFSYFGYKSNTRAIKQWTGAAKVSNELLGKINDLNPDLIIHRGLSTTYLMGVSYLKIPQIAVYSQQDWFDIENLLIDRKVKRVLFLYWEGNQLVNDEFPKKIWNEKFDISFDLETGSSWEKRKVNLVHFKGLLLDYKF
ncbi:LA_3751/LA_3752 family putative glycosyltransferase [Leptospira levettii]|uniref:LA_3751/LA_3752 family putative glycosyltransferase n=1 Tax=Leptospira levettii TaxID=2023178 RepID=UPI00223E75F5|nr:hypothetical protein [Leptospira levettii]MCW7472089.1 hypothetical protein [Leptospira levettii]